MLVLVCAAAATAAHAQQTPQRDLPRVSLPGTGSIRGTVVVDDESKAPMRRAIVTLVRAGIEDMRSASTDEQGAFTFTDLPAATYTLNASKGGFIAMSAGAARSGMPGRQIVLRDGGTAVIPPIALARGAVIAGRVMDPLGQPVITAVAVSRFILIDGVRRPRSESGASVSTETNDHGEYRVFGLPAGEYLVSVRGTMMWQSDVSSQELDFVQRPPAAGGTTAPPSPPRPFMLAPTLYPAATSEASATPVVLAAGEERLGVDISLQRVPVARVSGVVTGLDGKPLPGVSVDRAVRNPSAIVPNYGPGARTLADGSFVLAGLPPGDYLLQARVNPMAAVVPVASSGAQPLSVQWGNAEVTVSGADIGGVSIRMQPGMTVSGQVGMKGAAPPVDSRQLRITLMPLINEQLLRQFLAQPDSQNQFSVEGVPPGRYRLFISAPAPYVARSAMLGEQDLLDASFEVLPNSNVTGIAVMLTDARTELGGRLTDGAGQPASNLYVLVFSQDRDNWRTGSRRIASVRARDDGSYAVDGLPPGDYYLCALTEIDTTLQFEPTYLEELTKASLRISLGEGEKKVQNLRAGG